MDSSTLPGTKEYILSEKNILVKNHGFDLKSQISGIFKKFVSDISIMKTFRSCDSQVRWDKCENKKRQEPVTIANFRGLVFLVSRRKKMQKILTKAITFIK